MVGGFKTLLASMLLIVDSISNKIAELSQLGPIKTPFDLLITIL
jgi:hypothetical protein